VFGLHAYHRDIVIRAVLAIAVLAVLLVAPRQARAAFSPLGPALTPVFTDGARYAAWQRERYVTRVLDTSTGETFDLATPRIVLQGPQPQSRPGQPTPPRPTYEFPCRVTSLGAGLLVWDCLSSGGPSDVKPPWGLRLFDLRTRTEVPVRGLGGLSTRFPAAEAFGFGDVGSQWVAGVTVQTPPSRRFFLNWRTGRIVAGELTDRPSNARSRYVRDLDRAGLETRLCDPLRRMETRGAGYQYERPFGLALVPTGTRWDPVAPPVLRLDRCGRPPLRLARCRCWDARLASGLVSWHDGARVVVYRAHTGRRTAISTAGLIAGGSVVPEVVVRHTARQVFLAVSGAPPNQGDWRVYAAPLAAR
jgi:hypothetical protein